MNLCVACIGQTVLPGVVIWCLDFMMFEKFYCILAILSHKSTSSLYLMPTHRHKSFKQRNQNRWANKITCELPPFRPFNIFQHVHFAICFVNVTQSNRYYQPFNPWTVVVYFLKRAWLNICQYIAYNKNDTDWFTFMFEGFFLHFCKQIFYYENYFNMKKSAEKYGMTCKKSDRLASCKHVNCD